MPIMPAFLDTTIPVAFIITIIVYILNPFKLPILKRILLSLAIFLAITIVVTFFVVASLALVWYILYLLIG